MSALGLIDDGRSKLAISRQKDLAVWTERAQARFLAAFGETGSMVKSWRAAKISHATPYEWLKNDPTFPSRFKEAEQRSVRRLQDEAIRRARDGVKRLVLYKGKPVKVHGEYLYETTYSDNMLMFMLKSLDPERFKDRTEVSTVWDGKIESLTDPQLETMINHVFKMACGGDEEAAAAARKQIEAELQAGQMTVDVKSQVIDSVESSQIVPEYPSSSQEPKE